MQPLLLNTRWGWSQSILGRFIKKSCNTFIGILYALKFRRIVWVSLELLNDALLQVDHIPLCILYHRALPFSLTVTQDGVKKIFFWVKNSFSVKNFCGSTFFFGSNISGPYFFGSKKIWVKKICVKKICVKIYWVKIYFWSKKSLSQDFFLSYNDVGKY